MSLLVGRAETEHGPNCSDDRTESCLQNMLSLVRTDWQILSVNAYEPHIRIETNADASNQVGRHLRGISQNSNLMAVG